MQDPATAFFLDSTLHQLHDHVNAEDWLRLGLQSAQESAERINRIVPPPAAKLEGKDAANYIEVLMPALQKDILARHGAYSSVRWLWYLRRTPNELFEGQYGTTSAHDRTLAELVSWYQYVEDTNESSGGLTP